MVFRVGIFCWIIILITDLLASWDFYLVLRPVYRDLSLLMGWLRLIYTAILGTTILNYVHVLLLLSGADHLASIVCDQRVRCLYPFPCPGRLPEQDIRPIHPLNERKAGITGGNYLSKRPPFPMIKKYILPAVVKGMD